MAVGGSIPLKTMFVGYDFVHPVSRFGVSSTLPPHWRDTNVSLAHAIQGTHTPRRPWPHPRRYWPAGHAAAASSQLAHVRPTVAPPTAVYGLAGTPSSSCGAATQSRLSERSAKSMPIESLVASLGFVNPHTSRLQPSLARKDSVPVPTTPTPTCISSNTVSMLLVFTHTENRYVSPGTMGA